MKNEVPEFVSCIYCKRSLLASSKLWAEHRVCNCCKCFGMDTDPNKKLLDCKRVACVYYENRINDFIMDDVESQPKQPVAKAPYEETSDRCFSCDTVLTDFLYINGKATQFDLKGEIESRCKNIKAKLCHRCAKELAKFIPINLIREDK